MKVIELKVAMDSAFADVQERFAEVDGRFETVDRRLDAIDRRFDVVEDRIASEGETTRRHFDVIAEQLRAEIAMLADAVVRVTNTLERSIAANRSEHTTITSALDNHEVRLAALERHKE